MIARQVFPAPPDLAGLLENIVCYSGTASSGARERVLPSGTAELIIDLRGEPLRCYDVNGRRRQQANGPVVAGVHHGDFWIEAAQLEALVSIQLRPGAVWRLFGVPAWELADQHVEIDTLVRGRLDTMISALRARPRRP